MKRVPVNRSVFLLLMDMIPIQAAILAPVPLLVFREIPVNFRHIDVLVLIERGR